MWIHICSLLTDRGAGVCWRRPHISPDQQGFTLLTAGPQIMGQPFTPLQEARLKGGLP